MCRNIVLPSLTLLLIAATITLLALTGCQHPSPSKLPAMAAKAEFVGDAACAECHEDIAAVHRRSNHAATLRRMSKNALGKLAPPTGRVPDSKLIIELEGDGYVLRAAGEEADEQPIDLAFGSGKTGMTYVSFMAGDTLLELRKSYFPPMRSWYLTPGHPEVQTGAVGMPYETESAKKCALCHAVTLPPRGVRPEEKFFGVGCEACHGPGSAHVIAAQAKGVLDLKMEKLEALSATRINEDVCGKCHRTAKTVNLKSSQARMTQRFQPYGLMLSRCFLDGDRRLSCLTCHDSHTDTSHDTAMYERKCLSCHSNGAAVPPAVTTVVSCPINPKNGCIRCHMPKRQVFTNTTVPTKMADHLIRIHYELR